MPIRRREHGRARCDTLATMALAAAFTRDDGRPNVPGVDALWDEWVAASRTMNFSCEDPLLDWLNAYGEVRGFVQDSPTREDGLSTDFRGFIFRKGLEFEAAVISHLSHHCQVRTICEASREARERARVEATWSAMRDGVEVIVQGVLWNAETQTYGAPDLLVRSDVLSRMFPDSVSDAQASRGAPDLALTNRHYRVVDVKFTTLDLLKDGHAGSSHLKHMVQIWLYNEALGRMQGFTPDAGFLLGRRWKQSKARGDSALDRLARIDRDRTFDDGTSVRALATGACEWLLRVRREGASWQVLPEPTVAELRPNMRHIEDQPWHRAKSEVARTLEDLTLLPRVTPDRRAAALAGGVCRWTDPRCSAALFGITGDTYETVVNAVIAANHSAAHGALVFPGRVTANEAMWRDPVAPEFYVDFETVTDLDEDFSTFPVAGGQPLIFMIGCGHLAGAPDRPVWTHRAFTTASLTLVEERRIIDEWLAHMAAVCADAGVPLDRARAFHWSPAETSTLTSAYNAAIVRQGQPAWPAVPWIDLLNRVVKLQPVTVRGAFGFGLKAIARALHAHGFIETLWQDSATDGLGAMVGAWSCHHEARRRDVSMTDLELMREIEAYNEVDCKVMAEVLSYLRRHR
jgi:hypothetical protein